MYNIIFLIINLLGGLGLFLYGMKLMGDGLENAAGDKLKGIFDRITSNPVKGVLTGTIVTAIIQSSSATTVMVVGSNYPWIWYIIFRIKTYVKCNVTA